METDPLYISPLKEIMGEPPLWEVNKFNNLLNQHLIKMDHRCNNLNNSKQTSIAASLLQYNNLNLIVNSGPCTLLILEARILMQTLEDRKSSLQSILIQYLGNKDLPMLSLRVK